MTIQEFKSLLDDSPDKLTDIVQLFRAVGSNIAADTAVGMAFSDGRTASAVRAWRDQETASVTKGLEAARACAELDWLLRRCTDCQCWIVVRFAVADELSDHPPSGIRQELWNLVDQLRSNDALRA